MKEPTFSYDEMSDTLYVSFAPGEKATGIELNDHIILRINTRERRTIGITFLEYSLLAQKTEVGPRSFPLSGLSSLSEALRELVLDMLRDSPVSDILFLSAYTLQLSKRFPLLRYNLCQ